MEMQLNAREASLVEALRRLPPDNGRTTVCPRPAIAELAPNRKIDWSDSWSDEDLQSGLPL